MPTNVFTKKAFIAMIEKEMGENQLVVATSAVNGTMSVAKGQLRIPFAFDAAAFKDQGVGHIAFGQTWCIACTIVEPTRISELGQKLLIKSPNDGKRGTKKLSGKKA